MLVVIDPGHGGRDRFNRGPTGYVEADGTLTMALIVRDILRLAGVQVMMTRETDIDLGALGAYSKLAKSTDLSNRAKIANNAKADYFISIHTNANDDPRAAGTETYCYALGGQGEQLAKAIQTAVVATLGTHDRGVKSANFAVLRETDMPAALVEVMFHTNPDEERRLKDAAVLRQAGEAIARGVLTFLGVDVPAPADSARLIVHGKEISGGAKLIDGRAYTWTRGLAEALGHTVRWDATTRTVYVDSEPALPRLDRYGDYDVITCKPSQVVPAIIKGILTVDGINGGYLDGTLNPLGLVVIDGNVVSERVSRVPPRTCLIITNDRQARIAKVDKASDVPDAKHILGGGPALFPTVTLDEGFQDDIMLSVRERTMVGITHDGELKLITTGRKTLKQLSGIAGELGCVQAINFDGGGSTTMRFAGELVRTGGRMISTALILKEG